MFDLPPVIGGTKKTMKKQISYLTIFAAFAIAPLVANAADEPSPGKASDGVKETAAKPEGKAAAETATDSSKDPGKASDGVTPAKVGSKKFHGKITSVNQDAKTVTLEDKKMGSHTVHVGDTTKLKKGNDTATWADLKVGDEVHGLCVKDGERFHAEHLMIGAE